LVDLDRWYESYTGLVVQQLGVRAFLSGRFDVPLTAARE
jgi:hypothetical protein